MILFRSLLFNLLFYLNLALLLIAAIPEEKLVADSPPSRILTFSSKAATVGFELRL